MSDPFEASPDEQGGGRRLRTVVFHTVVAYFCFAVAIFFGDTVAVVLTGVAAAIATVTLVRFCAEG